MAANDDSIGAMETKSVTVSDSQEVTIPLMDQEEGKSTILIVGSSEWSEGEFGANLLKSITGSTSLIFPFAMWQVGDGDSAFVDGSSEGNTIENVYRV